MTEAVVTTDRVERATGRAWDERVRRALNRAEAREWTSNPELRGQLALQDRRILAAEIRRLQAQVAALLQINEDAQ